MILQDAISAGFTVPEKPSDLSDRKVQEKLSPVAIKAFVRLSKAWGLKDDESRRLLGGVSSGTFYGIKKGTAKSLDQDQLTRISLLVGIFKALAIIFPDKLAKAWPTRGNDNSLFAGASPLTYMLSGGIPAMMTVRQLLDARRGVH